MPVFQGLRPDLAQKTRIKSDLERKLQEPRLGTSLLFCDSLDY